MSKIPHMMAPFQQLVYSACDEYIHCTMISIFSGGAPKGVCMVIKMEIKSVIKFEMGNSKIDKISTARYSLIRPYGEACSWHYMQSYRFSPSRPQQFAS